MVASAERRRRRRLAVRLYESAQGVHEEPPRRVRTGWVQSRPACHVGRLLGQLEQAGQPEAAESREASHLALKVHLALVKSCVDPHQLQARGAIDVGNPHCRAKSPWRWQCSRWVRRVGGKSDAGGTSWDRGGGGGERGAGGGRCDGAI
eukprot:7375975-Prymnesium_polylepis.2